MNKKYLYESIMRNVAKEVKKVLNEGMSQIDYEKLFDTADDWCDNIENYIENKLVDKKRYIKIFNKLKEIYKLHIYIFAIVNGKNTIISHCFCDIVTDDELDKSIKYLNNIKSFNNQLLNGLGLKYEVDKASAQSFIDPPTVLQEVELIPATRTLFPPAEYENRVFDNIINTLKTNFKLKDALKTLQPLRGWATNPYKYEYNKSSFQIYFLYKSIKKQGCLKEIVLQTDDKNALLAAYKYLISLEKNQNILDELNSNNIYIEWSINQRDRKHTHVIGNNGNDQSLEETELTDEVIQKIAIANLIIHNQGILQPIDGNELSDMIYDIMFNIENINFDTVKVNNISFDPPYYLEKGYLELYDFLNTNNLIQPIQNNNYIYIDILDAFNKSLKGSHNTYNEILKNNKRNNLNDGLSKIDELTKIYDLNNQEIKQVLLQAYNISNEPKKRINPIKMADKYIISNLKDQRTISINTDNGVICFYIGTIGGLTILLADKLNYGSFVEDNLYGLELYIFN